MSKLAKALLFMLAVTLAVIASISGYNVGKQTVYPVAYSDYIVKYAHKNGLDPFLVMAVIKQESNFVPEAASDYAHGLMQITPETAEWNARAMGLTDYDYLEPETNIEIGCHYLAYLIDTYGNIDTALAAYNAGMGNVNSWLSDKAYSDDGETLKYIPFPETRSYVEKVNASWDYYRTTDFADLDEDKGKISN